MGLLVRVHLWWNICIHTHRSLNHHHLFKSNQMQALADQLGAAASSSLRPPLLALGDLQQEVARAADRLGGGVQPSDLLAGVTEEVEGLLMRVCR